MAQFKHYSLEKYRGPGSKHRCPNCGEKTWKPYVDESGTPFSEDFKDADPKIRELAETVGRCDNVRKCGWNYTPKQFFEETRTGVPKYREGYKPPPPPTTAKPLNFEYVRKSFRPYHSTFAQYLRDVAKFPKDRLDRVLQDYWVGATKSQRICYWMIDINGNCVDGKFMAYKPDGHRDHDQHPTWARKWLIQQELRQGRITRKQADELEDQLVPRPYFGTHLLADPRYKDKPVALVEGEKSCLICSTLYPRYLWIACGTNTFNIVKLLPVISQKRKLFIFPDVDPLDEWEQAAKELKYRNVVFMGEYIKENARTEKDDSGDINLRLWMENPWDIIDSNEPNATEPTMAQLSKPTVAQPTEEPEWTAEDEAKERLMEAEVVEQALGYDKPNEALRLLMFGLDLRLASGETITEPDYIGF